MKDIDYWRISAIAERILSPEIRLDLLNNTGKLAYSAARDELQKFVVDTDGITFKAFIAECQQVCHKRAVAVVNAIRADVKRERYKLN